MNSRAKKPEVQSKLKRVSAGVGRVSAETVPDSKDIEEIAQLTAAKAQAEVANEWLLIDLRKKYGHNIIRFMWIYFIFVVLAITGHAFRFIQLPDVVLAALIGGTAVSVLGVVGTVAAGLFKPPSPK